MPLRKSKKAGLRSTYGLLVEISLVAALLLLILAFRTNIQPENGMDFSLEPQEMIPFDETPLTVQIRKPPPPPRPPVPVVVPDDTLLDDDDPDFDASIDIEEAVDPLKTPPPEPDEPEKEKPEVDFFIVVEVMPCLLPDSGVCEPDDNVPGLRDIGKKIRYPEIARKAGVEGRVILQFIVNENGSVTEVAVVRGIGAGCDEEALRVVREAKFKPGKQRGKAVKVKMSLPITFKLR